MSDRELQVTVNELTVGSLRESNDLWTFEYSASWAEASHGFDLSPALPRADLLHRDGASNRPVQWYFDNLLPEEAMRTLLAKEAHLSAEDAFGLLAYFGSESAGSLILRDLEHPAIDVRGLRPLTRAELNERITNMPRVSLTNDAPKKMSLAGAQHKLLIVLKDDELFEPLPGTPSTHILKPNHLGSDYPASAMNEYFTMRLANAVGLRVASVRYLYVPQPVYIVERFDRSRSAHGIDVHRRHLIDTCQLLNKARAFKYTAATLATLQQAATLCRSKAAARLQLYRWLVFNVLVGNADNHLKNISFLVDFSGIQIAPAYDLLCTTIYDAKVFAHENAHWPASPLSIHLGDAASFAEVRRAHVLEAGRVLGLSKDTAKRQLDRLLKIFLTETDVLIAKIEVDTKLWVAASAKPSVAGAHRGGEIRLLNAIRHIVVGKMVAQLV